MTTFSYFYENIFMKTLHPAQLLNELMKDNINIIKIEVRKLNKLIEKLHKLNLNCHDCYFVDISDFVERIIFNKHQSIIGINEIYILNNQEIKYRIANYCDMYEDLGDLSFIREIWNKI